MTKKPSELDGDALLRQMHKAPRKRFNDERFSEDLPDYMWEE